MICSFFNCFWVLTEISMRLKLFFFFRLTNEGRETHGRGAIHWLQWIVGQAQLDSQPHSQSLVRAWKINGENQLVLENTAAFCSFSLLERIRQSLQSPFANTPSSQSALCQVLCYLYSFSPISPQAKTWCASESPNLISSALKLWHSGKRVVTSYCKAII